DYLRILRKEIWTGLLLGIAFGAYVAAFVLFFQDDGGPAVAAALGSAMVLIALAANLVGASLPFLFSRVGLDPALTSSPGITSLTDVLGLLIYFGVASWILF